jgi:hypothetical protein
MFSNTSVYNISWGGDSSVGRVPTLRAGKPTNRDAIGGWGMRFFFTPKRPDRLPRRHSFLFNEYSGIFPGNKAAEV